VDRTEPLPPWAPPTGDPVEVTHPGLGGPPPPGYPSPPGLASSPAPRSSFAPVELRPPWQQRRPWLLLLATLGLTVGLFVGEGVAVELGYLLDLAVGDVVLWVLGPLGVALGGSLLYRAVTGTSLWGERRPGWGDLGWGVLAGVTVLVVDLGLYAVFDAFVPDPGAPVQGWIDDAMAATPWLVGLGVSLATPLGEEVAFRGLLLRGFGAPLRTSLAVAASSVAFGLVHLENVGPSGWIHVVSAGLAGAVFALAVLRAGHLVAGVVAHVVVNAAYTVVGVVAGGLLVWTVGPGGDLPALELEVGECAAVDWWEGQAVDRGSVVPCTEPHDLEVASRGALPGGPWDEVDLDDGRVADAAEDACLDAFERYVDADWDTSSFDHLPVLPSAERWDAGDRELVCLVVPWDDDRLTEPAEGSGL
jgi:membrane protease YdiL (CAAX protease family)